MNLLLVLRNAVLCGGTALIVSACGGDNDGGQLTSSGTSRVLASADTPVQWFRDVTIESGIAVSESDLRAGYGSAWGDFNGDGWFDIWVVNHMYEPSLYVNNRNGTFSDAIGTVWSGSLADFHGAAWGDFDNDGDQDLAQLVGNSGGTSCTDDKPFYVNEGGMLVNQAAQRKLNDRCGRGRTPLWLDWNSDGQLDLYLVNERRSTDNLSPSRLMIQQPDRTFAELIAMQTQSSAFMAQLAWLNGALHVLTVGNEGIVGFNRVGVTTPLPVRLPDYPTGQLPTGVNDIAIGDFDGDLQDDLFVSRMLPRGKSYRVSSDGRQLDVLVKGLSVERGVSWSAPAVLPVRFRFYDTKWANGDIRLGRSAVPATSVRIAGDVDGDQILWTEVIVDPADPSLAGIPAPENRVRRGVYIGRAEDGRWLVYAKGVGSETLQFDMLSDVGPISDLQSSGFSFVIDLAQKPSLLFYADGAFRERSEPWRMNVDLSCESVVAGDFDNDMDLDLFMACTGPLDHVYNRLFENKGGYFEEVSLAGGGAVMDKLDPGGHISAADYDNDGYLDMLISEGCDTCGPPLRFGNRVLLKNMRSGNHSIQLDMIGCQSNRDGVGARVVVTAGGKKQLRIVGGGMHNATQSMSRMHFGLGPNMVAASVRVKWPSGKVSLVKGLPADQIHTIREDPACSRP